VTPASPRTPGRTKSPTSSLLALFFPLPVVVHVVVAVVAAAVVGYFTHTPALAFMVLIAGVAALWRESDRIAEGDLDDPLPRNDWLLLAVAVLGAAAWGISKLVGARVGAEAGPGVAGILMLWMTSARIAIDGRRRRRRVS
jgi:hypothetical protein